MTTGKLRKLSPGATHDQWPQITADGHLAGFSKLRPTTGDPWSYGILSLADGGLREMAVKSWPGPWGLSPLGDYVISGGPGGGGGRGLLALKVLSVGNGEQQPFLEHTPIDLRILALRQGCDHIYDGKEPALGFVVPYRTDFGRFK